MTLIIGNVVEVKAHFIARISLAQWNFLRSTIILQFFEGTVLKDVFLNFALVMLDFMFIYERGRCHVSLASVPEYVASLNEQQQRHIRAFIEFMNAEYPQLNNKISFSMPMWLVGKKMYEGYVAVSAAKGHFSIHFSDEAFLNRLAESLPACKKGTRCINIKYGDYQSLHAVEERIDDFLNLYRREGSASQ